MPSGGVGLLRDVFTFEGYVLTAITLLLCFAGVFGFWRHGITFGIVLGFMFGIVLGFQTHYGDFVMDSYEKVQKRMIQIVSERQLNEV